MLPVALDHLKSLSKVDGQVNVPDALVLVKLIGKVR